MRKIIGLLGGKGAGKDTCAEFLIRDYCFLRASFAAALYEEVAQAFGVSLAVLGDRLTKETPLASLALCRCDDPLFIEAVWEVTEQDSHNNRTLFLATPRSPRFIMQYWGTEYKRKKINDNYWLDRVSEVLALNPLRDYVITDVRFPNEAHFVKDLGGVLIRIRRAQLDSQAAEERANQGTAGHASETALLTWPVNYELENKEHHPDSLGEGLYRLGLTSKDAKAA
ncbi:MAG: hypothetical protein Q7S87_08770 [Agitococcus sp.]|nr:hypothetical protein [Agitococcus sp.]MDO9176990.1 hypothetical protein [Agitococcus sp.]